MHDTFVKESVFAEEVSVIGAMKDGSFVEELLFLKMVDDAPDIFAYCGCLAADV